jgi:hypothetical protein
VDDTELTKAETSRAAVLLTAVAKAAIAKLKREADMGWHYTKLYKLIDDTISKIITRECSKILLAAKTKPAQFNAEAKLKELRKQSRANLASELRAARATLRRINREILHAGPIAAKKVEEYAKEARKVQARRLLSAKARLKALREAELIASSEWAERSLSQIDKDVSVNYPPPPHGIFLPTKDGLGIPATSGIYFIWFGDTIMYVGQSINMAQRLQLGNHHILREHHKISFLLFDATELTWAENYYIGALRAPLNYGCMASHARAPAGLRT